MDSFYPFLYSVHYPNKLIRVHFSSLVQVAACSVHYISFCLWVCPISHFVPSGCLFMSQYLLSYKDFIVKTFDHSIFLLVLVLGLTGDSSCYLECIFPSSLLCLNYIDIMQNCCFACNWYNYYVQTNLYNECKSTFNIGKLCITFAFLSEDNMCPLLYHE